MLGQKKFGPKKSLGQKKSWAKKSLGWKKVWAEKKFGPKKSLGRKKVSAENKLSSFDTMRVVAGWLDTVIWRLTQFLLIDKNYSEIQDLAPGDVFKVYTKLYSRYWRNCWKQRSWTWKILKMLVKKMMYSNVI